jgi:hypothetical protein
MQPGLYKVVLEADWTASAAMSADVRITVEEKKTQAPQPDFRGTLKDGQARLWTYDIPAGTSRVTFDLARTHDWSKWPTNDLGMVVFSPSFGLYLDGATLNAPERLVVDNPETGTWYLFVDAYEVWVGCAQGTTPTSNECRNSGMANYELYVTTE